jgi:deoxyribodipyrimidine photo-lyase
MRPKIHRLLPVFFQPLDNPAARYRWNEKEAPAGQEIDERKILEDLPVDRRVQPARSFRGGTAAGLDRLKRFIAEGLKNYDTARNLPHIPGTSEMSAYLHFGQIGPLTIAMAIKEADAPQAAKDAYLEEMIVRRELAINYVARNPKYDKLEGCHEWARKTLAEHESDRRQYIYTEEQFENAETHDPLWNAAQREMVITGRMHGYLRMYWAKKILEWTKSPAEAFEMAVRLNDRYELDGRDPNGYTGVAWAIGGKHDRPWAPVRPIFGMIRYMTASGCARKFDVKAYLDRVRMLER